MERKTFVKVLPAAALFAALSAVAEAQHKGGKMLGVYYSWSGNTRKIANYIKSLTGADVVEIVPETPYSSDYNETVKTAKRENDAEFLRPIKNGKIDLSKYDTVFVGSPNWWGTVAAPVRTFLHENDFSGKTVALFMTHEGSRLGRAEGDVKKLCPKSKFTTALAVRGGSVGGAQKTVESWLKSIGKM